jgi:hypothetical protein
MHDKIRVTNQQEVLMLKPNRQIIDSTHIRANISVSSIAGLVRKCRENVLKTVEKQDAWSRSSSIMLFCVPSP